MRLNGFLHRNSAKILTGVSAIGVIATAVLAVTATPKAMELIEEAKEEKQVDKLTPVETVKAAWKPYVPAAVTGLTTISCIFGINYFNERTQASLISAYGVLDAAFKDYRMKTEELYGEDNNVEQEVVKSKFDKNMVIRSDKELFFDYQSMRYYESTFEEVKMAEHKFKEYFYNTGYACLNDYLNLLGQEPVDYGYDMGWNKPIFTELEFVYEKVALDDGLEAYIVTIKDIVPLPYV